MVKSNSKRNFLRWVGLTTATLAAGCGSRMRVLPTNVMAPEGIETICTNEDLMEVPIVKIIGNKNYIMTHSEAFSKYANDKKNPNKKEQIGWYYMMPLNKKDQILNGGEPSFGLVSVLEGARYTTDVGIPGGMEIIKPSAKGDLYLPFTFSKEVDKNNKIKYNRTFNFSDAAPITLKTDIPINDLTEALKQDNKKFGIAFLAENNFIFNDQVLITKDWKGTPVKYLAYPAPEVAVKEGYQPFFLVKSPFTLFEDPKKSDGMARIIGKTYGFTNRDLKLNSKIIDETEYIPARGFSNPLAQPNKDEKQKKPRDKSSSFVQTDADQVEWTIIK